MCWLNYISVLLKQELYCLHTKPFHTFTGRSSCMRLSSTQSTEKLWQTQKGKARARTEDGHRGAEEYQSMERASCRNLAVFRLVTVLLPACTCPKCTRKEQMGIMVVPHRYTYSRTYCFLGKACKDIQKLTPHPILTAKSSSHINWPFTWELIIFARDLIVYTLPTSGLSCIYFRHPEATPNSSIEYAEDYYLS